MVRRGFSLTHLGFAGFHLFVEISLGDWAGDEANVFKFGDVDGFRGLFAVVVKPVLNDCC